MSSAVVSSYDSILRSNPVSKNEVIISNAFLSTKGGDLRQIDYTTSSGEKIGNKLLLKSDLFLVMIPSNRSRLRAH